MKETDTISVLVCVHSPDHEHDMLLQRALESLVRQSYSDFETVIVMDECHSGTRSIVDSYADVLDIKIYERPRKQGLAAAKNFGLQRCSGDWICYLDADDSWLECKLEVQRNFMLSNPGIDFCFTEAWDFTETEGLRPNCFAVGQYADHDQIRRAISLENVLCHGSAMIRRIALESLGGYSTDRLYLGREDWDLWQRAIQASYRFAKVSERLYVYSLGTSVPR
jgi:glycosyltransferase involved in cell wall biosynthesis